MDANTTPQLKIFQKLGIMKTILPYYSKNYEEWGDLMWTTCYTSRLCWYKFEMVFLKEHLDCEFDFDTELVETLNSMGVDNCTNLDSSYELNLRADHDSRKIKNFMTLAKSLRFRMLKSLHFKGIEQLDAVGIRCAAKFFKFATPKQIGSINIESDKGKLDGMLNALCFILPRIKRSVVLSKFKISEIEFAKVRIFGINYSDSPNFAYIDSLLLE